MSNPDLIKPSLIGDPLQLPAITKPLLLKDAPQLRQKCQPVDKVNAYIRELAKFMLSQLEPYHAIGLAANQFGEMVQVMVVRLSGQEIVLINPVIIKATDYYTIREMCESLPGEIYMVRRPKIVKMHGWDIEGHPKSAKGHDLLAQALMHEYDHLQGTMIDKIGKYVGRVKR